LCCSIVTFACLIFAQDTFTSASQRADFKILRHRMVEEQIEARGIKDSRVLELMRKMERHHFVSSSIAHMAYADMPLPIGEGQTISQPYIVALMTELAQIKETDRVLEIGTGSGYQTAILAELAKEVYTIEILPKLADRAKVRLESLGYKNIRVKCGDGYLGWPEFSPFDAIVVTAAPPVVPRALVEQLAEGGRLVIPVGRFYQELRLLTKTNGKVKHENIIPVSFVPMIKGR